MARKPCLDCPRLTASGSRCPSCESKRQSSRNARRVHYHGPWQTIRKAVLATARSCSVCGTTEDLTVDHVIPRRLDGGVGVLCRHHNSSKGG
jgi:5-methylcytosine-specific restriction endonuclease McrA